MAAGRGHVEAIRVLADRGANLDVQNQVEVAVVIFE